MSTALRLGNKLGEAIGAPTIVSPAPTREAVPSSKPYPEIVGLLLLALALLFSAIVLAPEARIDRVPVNDLSFHLEASQRLGESIAHGEPFMDPWVSQWSLGFPLWRVYQPLPHLLAAVVIALARPFASPAASFAALYYLLLVLMPVSVYVGARLMGLNPLAAGLASILILAPAEEGDFSRYGLSYDAYAWRGSGLFSELVAFEMLMLALGLVAHAIDSGKGKITAALALALTALSHVFFGYIAFVSIAFWALAKPGEGRAQRITRAASISAKAMLLLAWFVIPMVLGGAEVNRSRWDPAYKFDSYGAQIILTELFSGKLLDFSRLPVLSLMVAAGALIAAFNLKDSLARRLLVLTALWLALYFGRPTWGHLLVLAGIPSQFHLHRLEAAFELFAVLLAAWGLERIIAAAVRSPGLVAIGMGAVLGGALVLIAAERVQYLSLNAQWGESNLTAFDHERGDLDAALADLRAILAERPGRVSAGKAADWGGTFNIGSAKVYSFIALNGMDEASFLYHTISLTSDFMVLRDENDPVHEDLFGVRAVLAPVTLKLPPYFRKRGVHGRFAVYEASPTGYFSLVDIGARYDGGPATWFDPISGWLRSPMLHAGEVIALDPRAVAAPLITRWQQLPAPDPRFMTPRGQILSETKVGEDYRASIDAQRLCYALIKITYHPGLVAWVDGQRAPLLRVSPDFGAIALIPGHHDVEVRYQPGPLKPLLLFVGLALFVLVARPPLLQAWESAEDRLQEQVVVWGEWLTTDRVKTAIALTLLILIFTRALFHGQLIAGHDSGEYPPRLSEFAKIIGEHQFPPVWAPDLDNGHGQPLFEFAPPLIYVMALPFYECGVKLADSLQFGLIILFAMGAVALYLLGRRMSFSRIASLGGAAVWLFAPYQALDVYVSARFAEASAIAMAPVALLGLITALQNPTILNIALGAIAIALLPLAHNAIALLMFPIFALIILARSAVSDRPLRTAAAGASAIAGGLGLSAFFWLPALLEKDFVKTNLLRTDFLDWRIHIISPWQLLWGKWGFGYSVAGPNDGISFSLGWLHVALAIAGLVIGIRALNRMRRVDAMIFAGAVLGGSLLATEWTSPIWAHVTTLQYLAYPWRTLCIPALFIPLLALYVFDRLGPKLVVLLIVAVVLVNLSHTEPKGYLTFDEEFYEPASIAQRGLNTTTREEYEPRWVKQRLWITGNGFLNSPLWQSVRELYWTSTSHEYSVVTKSPMLAIDTTDYYPGWTVTIDGRKTSITPEPTFGLISFPVPAGQHDIKFDLLPTLARHFGQMASLATLLALLLAVAIAFLDQTRALWPNAKRRTAEVQTGTLEHPTEPASARGKATTLFRLSRVLHPYMIELGLFLLCYTVFIFSPVTNAQFDPMYSMLLSESILKNHTTALNQFSIPGLNVATLPSHTNLAPNTPLFYQLGKINDRVLYIYPHGTSLLSLPFVALMNCAGISATRPDGSYDFNGEVSIQKTLAALLMAILAVVFFKTASLFLPISWSLILTIGSTFGTQIWSTASRALWSQTWEVFLAGCVVFVLLRAEENRARLNPALLATLVSWMYFARPTGAVTAAGVTIFILLFYPGAFLTFLSTAGAWLAAFFTYSWLTFGQAIPDYYRQESFLVLSDLKIALAGILISPSRGLFVFVPTIPLVLYLVARHWRDLPHRRLALLALGIVSAQAALISSWPRWWGGWSYGPRLLTDTIPWFVLLAILGCKALLNHTALRQEVGLSQPNYHRFVVAIGFFLITLGIAINGAGALSERTVWWNIRPNIDTDPSRLWDWSSPQFLAAFDQAHMISHRHLALVFSMLSVVALLLAIAAAAFMDGLRKLWLGSPSQPGSLSQDEVIERESVTNRLSVDAGRSLANELDAVAKATTGTSAKLARIVGVIMLAVFLGQGMMFIRANSQTFDEAIHLVSGYSYLTTRDFRLFPQHPPLVPELSALPVYLWYRLPFKPAPELWNRPEHYFYGDSFAEWELGRDFLYRSSVPANRLLALSRIPNLLLGTILVALVGWWSYRLWGAAAAIVGIWLAAVDPNLVANSSLVTSDLAPALFTFLTLYLLWEFKRRVSGWLLAATGVSLGLALMSKFSTVLLLAILAVVVVGDGLPLPAKLADWRKRPARKLLQGLAAAGLILFFAALVIPIVYLGFSQVFPTSIAGLREVSTQQAQGFRAFFMGDYSARGWWTYFLAAFLLKTPVGSLFLIFAALALYRLGAPLGRKEVIFLLLPPIAFIMAASIGKIDIGLRHILPIYPFLFVVASRIATVPFRRTWVAPVVCVLPLMLSTVSSLRVAPHELAYFNELAGGPGNGYRYLSDSNIDWGQDLKGVKAYMDHEGLTRIYLSYFGTAPPSYYGIRYQYAPSAYTLECCVNDGPPPGSRELLAISVVNLQDVMAGGQNHFFDWLYERAPIAKIGYSIYVYDITGDVQAHLRLAEAYMRAGGVLPLVKSEVTKVLLLDPSNQEAKSLDSLLRPPTIKPLEAPPVRGEARDPDLVVSSVLLLGLAALLLGYYLWYATDSSHENES